MRTVCVRYLVPVYVTVDLDTDADPGADGWYPDHAVTAVQMMDESIVRLDDVQAIAAVISGDVLDVDYANPGAVKNPGRLSAATRARALAIAEATVWPAWHS